jgi:hypothetical protein
MHTFFNYLQKTLVEKVYLNAQTLLQSIKINP